MQEFWRNIPPDSNVVLYSACGNGRRAEELRQRYPQMRLIGVETDAMLRAEAQQYGFFVAESADVALAYLDASGEKVNAWILECRAWQDETFTKSRRRRFMKHLQLNATLLWQVSNSQYWQYLLTLFHGKTDGVARHTMVDLVAELQGEGVASIEVSSGMSEGPSPEFDKFMLLMTPFLNALNVSTDEWGTFFKNETIIVRGWYRLSACEPVNITAVLGETLVCARVRMDEPHAFLATLPKITYKKYDKAEESSASKIGKQIWIWQRRFFTLDTMIQAQSQLMRRRYLTIQEWDDDPLHWEEHFCQNRFIEFRSAHAIQTSTPALAEYLRQFNPEVKVFPNCIAQLPPLRFPSGPGVTIFFGAINREKDWKPIMPVLNQVLQRYGQRVKLIVVHDREFFDSVLSMNKEFFPFCEYSLYQKLLLYSDISLLPLLPSRFNQMKSDLKFVECAAWGTAVLASSTVYADTVKSRETGILYETEEQFRLGLEQLIEDMQFRRWLASNAWEWVKNYRLLSLQFRDRLQWYDSLFGRYDELTDAIEKRVPELQVGKR